MKFSTFFILFFTITICHSQSLPIDFENAITTADFEDFDGGTAEVIPNPQSNGINTSSTVAQIVRDGGTIWSGSKIELAANLDFSTFNSITMKVFTTAPIGTIVKFKLEGPGNPTERDVPTTVSGEWEEMTWDFTGTPSNLNTLVFMFDFGNTGNGSANSTFLFDDVEQLFGGLQLDLPVNFEGNDFNYTVTDFGGNNSSLIEDPTNSNNKVIQSIKTDQAATWAGTTIGTNAGFVNDIPLTLNNSIMSVRVWSPTAGTPIRLKVEDSNDPTHTCETEINTTVGGDWEIMEFDFATEAPGTAALSFGLSNGWTYNMASIFFNFGTEGATAGEQTYFFDDVYFGEIILSTNNLEQIDLNVFPNPSTTQWTISTKNTTINTVQIIDLQGRQLLFVEPNNTFTNINSSDFAKGIYFARITTPEGIKSVKLLKE